MPNVENLRIAIEDVMRTGTWRAPVWSWDLPFTWRVLTSMSADPEQTTILMYLADDGGTSEI